MSNTYNSVEEFWPETYALGEKEDLKDMVKLEEEKGVWVQRMAGGRGVDGGMRVIGDMAAFK